ncbi:hypothetical protein AB0O31_13525 [Kitasatospora cineracea]|uniref:hypothetical protein n=1 Tax=Kitasatospora cineracea TaxID=88074 RepID=UPI0034231432
MTNFLVSNEAGKAGAAFAARVEDALNTAAPRIVELAAMPLPDEVTVRLVNPGALPVSTRVHFEVVGRRIAETLETEEQRATALKVAAEHGVAFGRFETLFWPLISAKAGFGATGVEVVVVPEMHKAARTSQRALVQTLGHELVHVAQDKWWPGVLPLWARQAVEVRLGLRARADVLPVPQVSEAHGMWVHRKLVAELGGVDDGFPGDPRPTLYVRFLRTLVKRLPMVPGPALYLRGQKFMAALDEAGGPLLVASVFDGEATIPTSAELDDPELWLTRHRAGVAANGTRP